MKVLDPEDIQTKLMKHLIQWCEETKNPMAPFNAMEQLLLYIVEEKWSQAAQHFLQHHEDIDPNDEFSPIQFVSHQHDERHLPNVGGAI